MTVGALELPPNEPRDGIKPQEPASQQPSDDDLAVGVVGGEGGGEGVEQVQEAVVVGGGGMGVVLHEDEDAEEVD